MLLLLLLSPLLLLRFPRHLLPLGFLLLPLLLLLRSPWLLPFLRVLRLRLRWFRQAWCRDRGAPCTFRLLLPKVPVAGRTWLIGSGVCSAVVEGSGLLLSTELLS